MLKFIIVFIWLTLVFFLGLLIGVLEFIARLAYKLFINLRYRMVAPVADWAKDWFAENKKIAMTWLER